MRLQGKDVINSISIASLRTLLHYLLIIAVCLQVHCFLEGLAALPTDYCSLPAGPLLP